MRLDVFLHTLLYSLILHVIRLSDRKSKKHWGHFMPLFTSLISGQTMVSQGCLWQKRERHWLNPRRNLNPEHGHSFCYIPAMVQDMIWQPRRSLYLAWKPFAPLYRQGPSLIRFTFHSSTGAAKWIMSTDDVLSCFFPIPGFLFVFSNFDCVNVDVRIDTHTHIGINMLDISTLQKQDCKSFEFATSTATSLLREPNITCSDLNWRDLWQFDVKVTIFKGLVQTEETQLGTCWNWVCLNMGDI